MKHIVNPCFVDGEGEGQILTPPKTKKTGVELHALAKRTHKRTPGGHVDCDCAKIQVLPDCELLRA